MHDIQKNLNLFLDLWKLKNKKGFYYEAVFFAEENTAKAGAFICASDSQGFKFNKGISELIQNTFITSLE